MNEEKRNQLIEDYIPLANSLAWKKYQSTPSCVEFDDLKAAAYMGLVDAASRYDDSLGISFGVYSRRRIWGEICDYLRELRWGGKTNAQVVYLDASVCACLQSKNEFLDIVTTNEFFDLFTKGLNELANRIVRMYYMEGYSMNEIGGMEKLSESRISQILKDCRDKIKPLLEVCSESSR